MPLSVQRFPDPAGRSLERLRAHWEIERELAARLRAAAFEERTTLYSEVYDELFRQVPDHPQLVRRQDQAQREAATQSVARLVTRFLPEHGVFLEIGAGDCALSFAVAAQAQHVYAVEVSEEIAAVAAAPDNFELLITDGRSIPVPPGTVDLAYSNQLMEHLHPDDAIDQLAEIYRALRPGGRYICLTPNRLLGPADISKYFEDDRPSGFHLREYSNYELADIFARAGFASTSPLVKQGGKLALCPMPIMRAVERLFEVLPRAARRRLKQRRLVRKLLSPGGGVLATKP